MNRDNVISVLTEMLQKLSNTNIELSEATAIVKDVGLESIQVIEYLCEVEDYFEIIINEEKVAQAQTIGDLADVVREWLSTTTKRPRLGKAISLELKGDLGIEEFVL